LAEIMTRRRKILIGAMLSVVIGLLLCWPRGPQDPKYQGKRLSQWIKEAIPDGRKNCEPACKAIRSIGSNAVPYFLSEFIRPESKSKAAFNRWASTHRSINFRFTDHQDRYVTAAYGLALLAHETIPVLPTLADYLGDGLRGRHAAFAMAKAGDSALPHFLKAICSTNHDSAYNASLGLIELKDGTAAVPTLIESLKHTNEFTRRNAVWILGAIHSQSELIAPALISLISGSDPELRLTAIRVLPLNDPHRGKPAIPKLLQLMTSTNQEIAFAASNAVRRIDPSIVSGPPASPRN